jgi:hypothetical protein
VLIFGSRAGIPADENDLFLRAGYITVSIDYRLAPETKLPAILEDVEDAYCWVREKGPGLFQCDPERLAVVGQSGGVFSLNVRRSTPSFAEGGRLLLRLRRHRGSMVEPASITQSPPSDKRSRAASNLSQRNIRADVEPRADFYIYCRQNGLWPKQVAGFDPLKEPEKLIAYSPDHLVKPEHSLYRMRGFNHLFDVFADRSQEKPGCFSGNRLCAHQARSKSCPSQSLWSTSPYTADLSPAL